MDKYNIWMFIWLVTGIVFYLYGVFEVGLTCFIISTIWNAAGEVKRDIKP